MAKQIIEDAMWVTLPAYTVPIETPMPDGVPYTDEVFFEHHKSQPFRTVVQEQSAGTLRPDLTARLRNGSILFIEIYVTHAVEEAKAKALDNLMEVDLSNLTPEQKTDPDLLRQAVLESAPRRWFLCSLYDNLKRVKQAQATLSASAPDEWMRREQAKRELKLKRERAAAQAQAREQGRKRMEANKKSRDWQRRQHQHLIDHLAAARSDDYEQARLEVRTANHEAKLMREDAFRTPGRLITRGRQATFVGIPVQGDWIINADSEAWQALVVLDHLLCKRKGAQVNIGQCVSAIKNRFGILPWMRELNALKREQSRQDAREGRSQGPTKLWYLTGEENRSIVNPVTVVIRYLEVLSAPNIQILDAIRSNGKAHFRLRDNRLDRIMANIDHYADECDQMYRTHLRKKK
ncbi:hypothetical protein ACFPTY_10315 [Halomonas beimenensis]|nr:hypothetical protein [Halomonas beimenensis]